MKKEYSIGLDIGTTSVGWALVETDTQKIVRKGNQRLWGVRLFEEANGALARRNFRSTRRRYDRRRERINLLNNEFETEINLIDKNFYQKLTESFYNEMDIKNKTIPLTQEERDCIKQYYKQYPTIYHLRKKLIENKEKEDIRLVYLAIHHIIKYRGNFLYNGDSFNVSHLNIPKKLEEILNSCSQIIMDCDSEIHNFDFNELVMAILESSKNDRKFKIKEILSDDFPKYFIDEFTKLINGATFDFAKMLALECDTVKLSFSGSDYDDKLNEFSNILGDSTELISSFKELYDMIYLKRIFKGSTHLTLSSLMVGKYEIHKSDLRFLKNLLRFDRKLYHTVFKNKKQQCLYEKYVRNHISNADFCKEIQKYISKIFDTKIDENLKNQYITEIQSRMENGEFLPRITDSDNGKYPYQLNKDELLRIIENQGKYYPFLLAKTDDNKYKLVQLLEFKIPYYVGPLVSNQKSPFAWMERKKDNVKITPFNFEEVIDKEKTAENFIRRMISHCTYLLDEEAMPTNSILYSKFKVLNELKQIKVNGVKISIDIQQKIYKELFLKRTGTITEKVFKEYIHSTKDFDMYDDINIQGYSADKKFANNMQSYIDFFDKNGIFANTDYTLEDAEEIIEWITIFEDKDILKKKVNDKYPQLTTSQVNVILSKKYTGWSSLSKKLLTEKYYSKNDIEEKKSILDLMLETDKNFMQIINDDEYQFQNMIAELNQIEQGNKLNYELVSKLATSPATKRGIYQALKVVDELVKYIGHEPKYISIEMARGDEKKGRKDDKKQYLLNLYENAKKDIYNYNNLKKNLMEYEKIDSQKLFLYFIQEGKSLYSGKPLDINHLDNYEIDHIIPRTLIKDDSIDNKALVFREENQIKAASFTLPREYRTDERIIWWQHLKKIGLISNKKFYSLTRSQYSTEDIRRFINRQLVETRQITKHVANILGNYYKKSKIIYLHANLSHNYRERYELFKFREINDYHHAHDAYLAAVLGEYKEKLDKQKISFDTLKELNHHIYQTKDYHKFKYGYVINSLDTMLTKGMSQLGNTYNEQTGEILFDADSFNQKVEYNLLCNDILISRKTEIRDGEFYKQTIYPAGIGKIELKNGLPTNLYGGYANVNPSYLILVSYKNKQKIIGIPIQISLNSQNDKSAIDSYIRKQLNLKGNEMYKIIKAKIPFDALIDYKNQLVYIKGYSSSKKTCEVSNANQLKIPKDKMLQWKHTLNEILNYSQKYISSSEIIPENIKNQSIEIYKYLLSEKTKYPLFEKDITKIEKALDIEQLSFNDFVYIIKEIFKLYHCNSVNANLKEYGLGDRIGRLSGNTINSGIIINQSVSGIKKSLFHFEENE